MKKILLLMALLWGLPASAQNLPPGTLGIACLASANAPVFTAGNYFAASCDLSGNLRIAGGTGGGGSSAPANLTYTRLSCVLPQYSAGGNIVCTNAAGQQTTTACSANTACLVSAANANRKLTKWQNRTQNATIDIGYSASVAPGTGLGYDGPSLPGGQGGSSTDLPPHSGAYYAATATSGAVLVFVQGE